MKIRYRPFLLGFSIVYAGLAVGSLLIAISLAQSAAPTCVQAMALVTEAAECRAGSDSGLGRGAIGRRV